MLSLIRSSIKAVGGQGHNLIHVANLTGRATRGKPLKLRKGFPYQKRKITELEAMWDITVRRIEEENARIIVVDGPIAAGKSAVVKALAEEFDMAAFKEPTMDEFYLTRSGFDLRKFDDQLPEELRSYDHRNFCLCPTHINAGSFQLAMGLARFAQYIDALAHVLNTGQGVVLERSYYSDCAFAEAMYLEGYMTKAVRDYYFTIRDVCTPLLLCPHVVIYLDVPVNYVQGRIEARNLSYEVNSVALTPSYLQRLEDHWKNVYLREADAKSHVLVYDWKEGGDLDIVVEDLEKLDLDHLKSADYGKLSDWKTWRSDWRSRRLMYTNSKAELSQIYQTPVYNIPELLVDSDDFDVRLDLYASAPGNEFAYGFNPVQGDSMIDILLGFQRTNPRAYYMFTKYSYNH